MKISSKAAFSQEI